MEPRILCINRGSSSLELDPRNQIDRVPALNVSGAHVKEWLKNQIIEKTHHDYGEGLNKPEFTKWKLPCRIDEK